MADISNGPVSTLPGHSAGVPVGTKCDEHPDRDAVRRNLGYAMADAVKVIDEVLELRTASDKQCCHGALDNEDGVITCRSCGKEWNI